MNNAYRRIEEGKFDDAVARLYRSIELIAQIDLNRRGLIDSKNLKDLSFVINKGAFNHEIKDKPGIPSKLKLYDNNEYNNDSKTFKLTSSKSYELLRCLGSEPASMYIADTKFKVLWNLEIVLF